MTHAVSTTTKTVAALKTQPVEVTALQKKVDTFTTLHLLLTEVGAFEKMKEWETLKKDLAGYAAESKEATEVVLKGSDGSEVMFSAPSKKTEITSQEKLREVMGDNAYLAAAKVGVTEAKKSLTQSELDQCTYESIGSRTFKTAVRHQQV